MSLYFSQIFSPRVSPEFLVDLEKKAEDIPDMEQMMFSLTHGRNMIISKYVMMKLRHRHELILNTDNLVYNLKREILFWLCCFDKVSRDFSHDLHSIHSRLCTLSRNPRQADEYWPQLYSGMQLFTSLHPDILPTFFLNMMNIMLNFGFDPIHAEGATPVMIHS